MLSPELEQLHSLLASLKDHEHLAGLFIEDEFGQRWSVRRAFVVGARTDDPGLVIRLAASDRSTSHTAQAEHSPQATNEGGTTCQAPTT